MPSSPVIAAQTRLSLGQELYILKWILAVLLHPSVRMQGPWPVHIKKCVHLKWKIEHIHKHHITLHYIELYYFTLQPSHVNDELQSKFLYISVCSPFVVNIYIRPSRQADGDYLSVLSPLRHISRCHEVGFSLGIDSNGALNTSRLV